MLKPAHYSGFPCLFLEHIFSLDLKWCLKQGNWGEMHVIQEAQGISAKHWRISLIYILYVFLN